MEMKPLFDLVDAKPFRPFTINLLNGRILHIDHPDNIHFAPSRERVTMMWVYYTDRPEEWTTFFPDGINALDVGDHNGNGGE